MLSDSNTVLSDKKFELGSVRHRTLVAESVQTPPAANPAKRRRKLQRCHQQLRLDFRVDRAVRQLSLRLTMTRLPLPQIAAL